MYSIMKILGCVFMWFVCTSTAVGNNPGLPFIENKKQWDSRVDYQVKIRGGWAQVNNIGFTYNFLDYRQLENQHEQGHSGNPEVSTEQICGYVLTSTFLNTSIDSKPIPFGLLPTYHNYFLGSDSSRWSSKVGLYEGVIYHDLYAGVDLKMYSQGENLKYDFILAAGADPKQIRFAYQGADEIIIENGDVIIKTPLGDVIEKKPISYQMIYGEKVWITTSYELVDNQISFCFPNGYDPCYPLVIDPLLIFSTYSGSLADNWGSTATPGERGTLYSAGVATSFNGDTFPVTPGSFQTSYGGGVFDIGILKYDSSGRTLLYATYLGGSLMESAHSLVMNAQNELVVMGTTSSANFPTTANAFDRTFNGGQANDFIGLNYTQGSDIFIAKLSSDGSTLVASTLIGGTRNDGASDRSSFLVKNYGDELRGDVITAADGSILVSTVTSSSNFPVRNSFDLTYGGGDTDAVVFKMNADLSVLQWATFLGGSEDDASHTIQFDKNGDVFVAGGSNSDDFLMSASAYQRDLAGDADGWIAHIKADGSSLMAATYTGTQSFDQVYFVDLDREDNIFVYGQTSGVFPITAGTYRNANSGQFLQKFSHDLSTLLVSTVFGSGRGIPDISPTAFLVNDCNNIYLTGWGGLINSSQAYWASSTNGMPTTADAFQRTTSGSDFYFIVLSIDATELLYATYMGGTQSRTHVDGGTSRFDKGGVVYHAVCSGCQSLNALARPTSDFPTTAGAWSRTNRSTNCNNAAFKFDLSSLKARIQTNTIDLKKPGVVSVCFPDQYVFQNKSTGGEIYDWSFGDGTTLVKTDTARIAYRYKSPGTYTVKLKAIDAGTCAGKDSTAVTVRVFPVQGVVGPDQEMCFDFGTRLIASGGVSYSWTSKDNTFTSTQPTPEINPKEDATYYVTVVDVNGCIKKDTVNIKVIPGIDLKFDYSKINDCYSRPLVTVKNLTDTEETVFFDFGDGTTSDLEEDQHYYSNDGVYRIKLVGLKESCVYEKSVDLPFYDLRVPNVITPGSPGFNDTFKIGYGSGIISTTSLKVSVRIFNRWGNKVFESDDYKDNWAGEGVAAGVYYYELEVEGEAVCKGWVHVIK